MPPRASSARDGVIKNAMTVNMTAKRKTALENKRANAWAEEQIQQEKGERHAPDLSGPLRSLWDDIQDPPPKVPSAIDELAKKGHIVTLPSARKSGKSTLLMNLAWSGVRGGKFLEEFQTYLGGNVGFVNAEMTTDDFTEYARPMPFKEKDMRRIFPIHCRDEGIRLNLLNDETCSRFIRWLRDRDCEWLFLDPWKNFLSWAGAGMNDNDMVSRLADRVREIVVSAGISLCVIPMHTTQTAPEEGLERGKGAGELEDSADSMWRYTRVDGSISLPRILAVEGRGVGLEGQAVMYDEGTGLLSLGQGGRAEVRSRGNAEIVADTLELYLASVPADRCKAGELKSALRIDENKKTRAIRDAVHEGTILEDAEGPGKPTWYSMP